MNPPDPKRPPGRLFHFGSQFLLWSNLFTLLLAMSIILVLRTVLPGMIAGSSSPMPPLTRWMILLPWGVYVAVFLAVAFATLAVQTWVKDQTARLLAHVAISLVTAAMLIAIIFAIMLPYAQLLQSLTN